MRADIENEYIEANPEESFISGDMISRIALDALKATLNFEKFPYDAEISLLITTDDEIRLLNREFRDIDQSTDVLSFPMADFEEPGALSEIAAIDEYFDPETGEFMLGDIVISAETLKREASLYGHTLEFEFAFLIIHSILHLLGYDHGDKIEEAIMNARQDEILKRLNYLK